ncbi:hypothetical protein V5740_10940 [Croceibacterium sp. TMG7-5b_MA50]|uniref:hypothetical protein n=1 Tax=Croceibacterium sp. TMG7-5b_MA50 TaxID=3121290 RepID=UPI003221BF14
MNREQIVLTALPFSTGADAPFHVSVHVAPKLTPDQPERMLEAFAAFAKWGTAIAGTTLTLRDQPGAALAATRVSEVKPDLWPRMFPPATTPVRRPDYGNLHSRHWRSFPVKAVHDLAALTAVGSAMFFPFDPPSLQDLPREHPYRQLIRSLSGEQLQDSKTPKRFRDDLVTQALDKGGTAGAGGLGAVLDPLHRARRFYEPAGGNVRDGKPVPPPTPRPDFHERVAHLSDQPELLRRLGLVIDLKVADLARLRNAKSLSVGALIDGVEVVSAITEVERRGDRLLTRPRTKDWTGGRLRLGEEDLFAALTMDSDGAAMKLGNFIRALPRMLWMADNGDPGHVAPPALRSEGFTIVRTGRVDGVKEQAGRAAAMAAQLASGVAPLIAAEDVTQGYRVEVWDDHEKKWFSLHRRLATATVAGQIEYADRAEAGWVGTAAVRSATGEGGGDAYLHEALFGWSGWSLSAPRPGPRAEPEDVGGRQVENVRPVDDPAGITPVTVTTKVQPGTLPRLRFGRSYAFRAWGVDLAGNSHGGSGASKPRGTPGVGGGAFPAPAAPDTPLRGRPAVGLAQQVRPAADLVQQLGAAARAPVAAPMEQLRALRGPAIGGGLSIVGEPAVDGLLATRIAARTNAAPTQATQATSVLADRLRAGFAEVTLDLARPSQAEQLDRDDIVVGTPEGADTVTAKLPFLRWDPVPPPVVVPRHRFSPAESVHHLVIRSGVAADGTMSAPDAYIAEVGVTDAADWHTTSERHLAAPKGSQHLNELHGRFDAGIDDPAQRPRLLAAVLRDDGLLYDAKIVSPDDPQVMLDQPGLSLEAGPEVENPVSDLQQFVGDRRGDPIPTGHYVVHDTDQLNLPWLPDPLASGWALGMSGANRGSQLAGLFRTESTAGRYAGQWPAPEPVRLVLASGAAGAETGMVGNVLTIALPPGTRIDLRLSSSLLRDDLKLLALWNLFPPALRALDLVERPAADGQFWALTPYEPITLVHAVPRPVLAPYTAALVPLRPAGATHADLYGVIDIHAPSTDRIEAEARWTEHIDDLAADGPVTENKHAIGFTIQTDPDEDMVLLGQVTDFAAEHQNGVQPFGPVPGIGQLRVHRGRHQFGDTRHRRIRYAFRATTRFREYFPPQLMATVDSRSRIGTETELVIPSSAEPPVPEIDSVIPLMRWDEEVAVGQPFGLTRRRRAGLRIYLKRPWYRTGADEQLAVIVTGGGVGQSTSGAQADVSLWGADPAWFNAGPETPYVALSLEDLYAGTNKLDDRYGTELVGDDPRVSPLALQLNLPGGRGGRRAGIVGYRPQYNADRELWYVDVAIEPGAAVWPFVRLVVARYQPHSLPGLELSKPVACDFTQLLPERTCTVSRPDDGHVRVTVTGPIGLRATGGGGKLLDTGEQSPYPFGEADVTNTIAPSRRMFAAVEQRPAGSTSDLDWQVVREQELSIGGLSPTGDWAWTGVIATGQPVPLRTPEEAEGSDWRVAVREVEYVEGDPVNNVPTRQERTPYLDHVVF